MNEMNEMNGWMDGWINEWHEWMAWMDEMKGYDKMKHQNETEWVNEKE